MPDRLSHIRLAGTLPRVHPAASHVGKHPPTEPIEVTLLLRSRNEGAAFAHAKANSWQRPHERRLFSQDEITALHGPRPENVARVEAFVRSHGLQVIESDVAARTITVVGPAHVMEELFRVDLHVYAHSRGRYRSHEDEVHIPAELEGMVEAVFGLDTVPVAAPHHVRHPEGFPDPREVPHFTPPQLAGLYGFPAETDGRGQTIAILAFAGGYRTEDLRDYFKPQGLYIPHIVDVSVGRATNQPTGEAMVDGEVALDIEVAGAAAPGAKLAVYFAPNTNDGWVRAVNRVVSDRENLPSVLSISWGMREKHWAPAARRALDQAFVRAAHHGITVCVSSGDRGSEEKGPEGAIVHYPSSSEFVLACGGTRLTASGGKIADEVVWNEARNDHATGGGVSDVFALPAYQERAEVPPSYNDPRRRGRGVPDVSAHADPSCGYLAVCDGIETVSGGTSAATPMWAALIARINQALGHRTGYLNALAYTRLRDRGCFRDITSGTNGAYEAREGWDACTGWGSPNGTALLEALREGVDRIEEPSTGRSPAGDIVSGASRAGGKRSSTWDIVSGADGEE